LGYHYFCEAGNRKLAEDLFETLLPAETLLSYSAGIHASMWTGAYPEDHRVWLEWELSHFPNSVLKISRTAWKTKTLWAFLMKRFDARFFTYRYIPSELRQFFTPRSFDFYRPYFNSEFPSLFQAMTANNVRFNFRYCRKIEDIPSRSCGAAEIISLPEFDALGHLYGPDSARVKERTEKLFDKIRTITRNKEEIVILFSDHGMYRVSRRIDILALLKRTNLTLGRDYIFFLDSTMARFWTSSRETTDELKGFLSTLPEGKVISEEYIQANHLPLDKKFGDIIFLVSAGTEIFPNYFHPMYADYVKGLHGYDVNGHNSKGVFMVNRETALRKEFSLLYLAPLIAHYTGFPKPKKWKRGTDLDSLC
jgi:hypothetical protein